MKKSFYHHKGSFKGFLFISGLLIIAVILWYTQVLVNSLQEKSRQDLNFRVRVFEQNINNPNNDSELGFFFSEVIQNADYPIIYTDINMDPVGWRNISPFIDSLQTLTPELKIELQRLLKEMDVENNPIPINYGQTTLGYYHYGVSPTIKKLKWLPYIEIAAALVFILIGYFGFSQIKKSEERNIWVGMAKETAHQLGTPLSSIIGWVELMKEDPASIESAIREIEVDSKRLTKVASRFSQIGSIPKLNKTELIPVIENSISYFNKRLPQFGNKIKIRSEFSIRPHTMLNPDLFEWVLENLIKNSIDSIQSNSGSIIIATGKMPEADFIHIDISDTGKGISSRDRKNIFKPGFSSKKRGWGLGLTLAKRIVEDYHGGKLILKESRPGEGSTFRIMIKPAS